MHKFNNLMTGLIRLVVTIYSISTVNIYGASSDQKKTQVSSEQTYQPWIEISNRSSKNRNIFEVDYMQPLTWNLEQNKLAVMDFKIKIDDHKNKELNIGALYRYNHQDLFILGAYSFFDHKITNTNFHISGLTVGAEALSKYLDGRVNYYLPENKKKRIIYNNSRTINITGNSLIATAGGDTFERGLKGYDIELGTPLFGFSNYLNEKLNTKILVAHYEFYNKNTRSIKGNRIRIEQKIASWQFMKGNIDFTFNGILKKDKKSKSEIFLGIGARYTIGKATKTTGLKSRMMDAVVRDIDIITLPKQDPDRMSSLFLSSQNNQKIEKIIYAGATEPGNKSKLGQDYIGDGTKDKPLSLDQLKNTDTKKAIIILVNIEPHNGGRPISKEEYDNLVVLPNVVNGKSINLVSNDNHDINIHNNIDGGIHVINNDFGNTKIVTNQVASLSVENTNKLTPLIVAENKLIIDSSKEQIAILVKQEAKISTPEVKTPASTVTTNPLPPLAIEVPTIQNVVEANSEVLASAIMPSIPTTNILTDQSLSITTETPAELSTNSSALLQVEQLSITEASDHQLSASNLAAVTAGPTQVLATETAAVTAAPEVALEPENLPVAAAAELNVAEATAAVTIAAPAAPLPQQLLAAPTQALAEATAAVTAAVTAAPEVALEPENLPVAAELNVAEVTAAVPAAPLPQQLLAAPTQVLAEVTEAVTAAPEVALEPENLPVAVAAELNVAEVTEAVTAAPAAPLPQQLLAGPTQALATETVAVTTAAPELILEPENLPVAAAAELNVAEATEAVTAEQNSTDIESQATSKSPTLMISPLVKRAKTSLRASGEVTSPQAGSFLGDKDDEEKLNEISNAKNFSGFRSKRSANAANSVLPYSRIVNNNSNQLPSAITATNSDNDATEFNLNNTNNSKINEEDKSENINHYAEQKQELSTNNQNLNVNTNNSTHFLSDRDNNSQLKSASSLVINNDEKKQEDNVINTNYQVKVEGITSNEQQLKNLFANASYSVTDQTNLSTKNFRELLDRIDNTKVENKKIELKDVANDNHSAGDADKAPNIQDKGVVEGLIKLNQQFGEIDARKAIDLAIRLNEVLIKDLYNNDKPKELAEKAAEILPNDQYFKALNDYKSSDNAEVVKAAKTVLNEEKTKGISIVSNPLAALRMLHSIKKGDSNYTENILREYDTGKALGYIILALLDPEEIKINLAQRNIEFSTENIFNQQKENINKLLANLGEARRTVNRDKNDIDYAVNINALNDNRKANILSLNDFVAQPEDVEIDKLNKAVEKARSLPQKLDETKCEACPKGVFTKIVDAANLINSKMQIQVYTPAAYAEASANQIIQGVQNLEEEEKKQVIKYQQGLNTNLDESLKISQDKDGNLSFNTTARIKDDNGLNMSFNVTNNTPPIYKAIVSSVLTNQQPKEQISKKNQEVIEQGTKNVINNINYIDADKFSENKTAKKSPAVITKF